MERVGAGGMGEPMPEKWFQTLCELQTRTVDKFSASVDLFLHHDEGDHRQFREAIATMVTAIELLRAGQAQQKEELQDNQKEQQKRWDRVWTVVIAPIVGGVLIAVLALVLK